MRWPGLPAARDGLRIGLLGGSFNPPHAGHRQISLMALKRLGLDAVWWLVTPGNPLKSHADLAPLIERIRLAEAVGDHPRIHVTAVEADVGLSRTADTVRFLRARCPRTDFVWLMGADNLAGFTRWYRFRDIAAAVPFAVVNRPGSTLAALNAPAAQLYARYRLPEEDAPALPGMRPPAWTFLHGPLSPLSSTALRAATRKPG
ncbi:MAG: nicotinate-nucleotide adenylyltransferase [Flavobacteriaceae bacterium]